jgi:hypothetical protein
VIAFFADVEFDRAGFHILEDVVVEMFVDAVLAARDALAEEKLDGAKHVAVEYQKRSYNPCRRLSGCSMLMTVQCTSVRRMDL